MRGLVMVGLMVMLVGCTRDSRSPDAIRQDTANATRAIAKDSVAVIKGVGDGLKGHKGPVNINKDSSEQLQTLPGMTVDAAERIVANRPYAATGDLMKRRLVSKAEYEQIRDKITVLPRD